VAIFKKALQRQLTREVLGSSNFQRRSWQRAIFKEDSAEEHLSRMTLITTVSKKGSKKGATIKEGPTKGLFKTRSSYWP
jgi:hypothetical protein